MTKLYLTLQPQESGKTFTYNYCSVSIELTLDRSLKCSDTYSILLYNSHLMLLCGAKTSDNLIERSGKTFRANFHDNHIWVPGDYFLLLRNGAGMVWRFDICLDETGQFHVQTPYPCPKMSDEDMLSGRLYGKKTQWRLLSNRSGHMQLKRWAIQRAKENELNEMRSSMLEKRIELSDDLLISSRTRPCNNSSIILLMHVCEVDTERKFANCESFYDTTKSNPYEALNEFFDDSHAKSDFLSLIEDSTKRHTYVFSRISALLENGGKTIMKVIRAHWPDGKDSAVFYGSGQEISALLEQNPSLGQIIPKENRLAMEPYSLEEMLHTFFEETASANLTLSPEAVDKACRIISQAYEQGIIGHWQKQDIREYVTQNLKPSYCKNAINGMRTGGLPLEVQPADIDEAYLLNQSDAYNEALKELQAMVGLKEIKQSILTLSHRVKFFQERRQLGLHCSEGMTYHTILTGNPGTGKTTVAKLLGKIYHSLGLLSKGEVVYADRTTIIGKFIGDTEKNMKQILKEAQGNVLLIDEAYTLYTKGDERDFGRHAVECLLDVLTRKNPDMLIVFAGYKKEMDALLSMNQGLDGRFPYHFHFSDYSVEELMQIAEKLLATDQYELTEEARALLQQTIREAVAGRHESFGNARWVEQLIHNGIIPALADRVSGSPHTTGKTGYQRIESVDVRTAAERFKSKRVEIGRRPAIGFCA